MAFDGYGYGEDGSAWGGEFLLADYSSFQRLAHFKDVPLPGGDLASKQPWRMTLSYLLDTFGYKYPKVKALEKVSKNKIKGIEKMIEQNINSPPSSSCGRLFDAVSYLVGLSPLEAEYEAEAPMRMESVAKKGINESYRFSVEGISIPFQISFSQTIKSILKDLQQNIPVSFISAKFHNTLAQVIVFISEKAKRDYGIDTVVFTGGVFLNKKLLHQATKLLEKKDFNVLRPINYSPNDESISLGQIAYALNKLKNKKSKL